jgi:hypothetical protein
LLQALPPGATPIAFGNWKQAYTIAAPDALGVRTQNGQWWLRDSARKGTVGTRKEEISM